jgi:hypothetical protein
MNEEIENVVDKYLTNKFFCKNIFIMDKYININKHVRKNDNKFVNFNIINHQCNLQKYCYLKF